MRKKDLNYSIELLRIIAAFLVITLHSIMHYIYDKDTLVYGIVFLFSLVTVCVPLFFMINGFFVFKTKKTTIQVWKSVLKSIVLPTIITLVLLQIFDLFILSEKSFLYCLMHLDIDFHDLFSHLLMFSSDSKHGFYLWFMFSLTYNYLWFPLLRPICVNTPTANKTRWFLEGLCFVGTIVFGTIHYLYPAIDTIITLPRVIPDHYLLYMLLGFEFRNLYDTHPEWFERIKTRLLGIGTLVVGILVTSFLTFGLEVNRPGYYYHYLVNYDVIGVFIYAIGFFMIFLTFKIYQPTIQSWIKKLGSATLWVYLIHWPIIQKEITNGFLKWLSDSLGYYSVPLYVLINIILCFSIVLVCQWLWHWLKHFIVKQNIKTA